MSTSLAAYAPYVPIFYAEPNWVTTNHYTFEPACLAAVQRISSSEDITRKALYYPAIFSAGRCTIGVYLTNPPSNSRSPRATAWKTIKQYALKAVSQLGYHGGGTSINLPSGMQIAVYEKQFIDRQNKCGSMETFQSDRTLTLEECLRQRVIEKGLAPPDPVPTTVTDEEWDISPQHLSEALADYIQSLRGIPSSLAESTTVPLDSIIAQITAESAPSASRSPSSSLPAEPSPEPLPDPAISPPTPTPARRKTKKPKRKKTSSTKTSDSFPTMTEESGSFPTMPVGPVDFAGVPLEVNIRRQGWARYGKLSAAKCRNALMQFRRLHLASATSTHIAFTVPEFFVSLPCVIGVYLTHPDPEGLDSMVKDNWMNVERKARLLTLDVTTNGGGGGYIDLKSGIQIVVFDKAFMDPDTSLDDHTDAPLSYVLDQRIYAREHSGTTLSWKPWYLASSPFPTSYLTIANDTSSFASESPGRGNVFVGLLDSWVARTPLSYTNCLHALHMFQSYPPLFEQSTITFKQPVIFSADNCAIGIFVTYPLQAPHEPVNVINTEERNLFKFAASLVELSVHKFGVGGFVDVPNGAQIAVWEKTWADPGNICGRISRVTLQDCLDMMVDYNSRVRRHAILLASIDNAGETPSRSLIEAAVSELEVGGSRIASSLLGTAAFRATTRRDLAGIHIMTNPAFQITAAPATPSGAEWNLDPRGGWLGRVTPTTPARPTEFQGIYTALAGFWEDMEGGTLSMAMLGGVGMGQDDPMALSLNEALRMEHLGGVVLSGSAPPRRMGSRGRTPQLGDAVAGTGVVVGEGAWVNQEAFLTGTTHLIASPTGRVMLVGKVEK